MLIFVLDQLIMRGTVKFQVMGAFRPYLRILQTHNIDNFRRQPAPVLMRRISLAICSTIPVMATPLVMALGVWHMNESALDIGEFSTSFAIMLAYAQIFLTTVAVLVKIQLIRRTMETLQAFVDGRKWA